MKSAKTQKAIKENTDFAPKHEEEKNIKENKYFQPKHKKHKGKQTNCTKTQNTVRKTHIFSQNKNMKENKYFASKHQKTLRKTNMFQPKPPKTMEETKKKKRARTKNK